MILRTDPRKRWNDHDFLLLEAYQILESERCPQCGLPRYICHNESNDLQFRVVADECSAKAHVDLAQRQKAASGGKNYEVSPGVQLRPEPYSVSGADLSSFREPYYRAEAQRREALAEAER